MFSCRAYNLTNEKRWAEVVWLFHQPYYNQPLQWTAISAEDAQKIANSTFWDSAALTGERRQMAISYTLSLYIHLSCIWGMQINQTEGRGGTHADDCSRASSCMIIFIPAHHVIDKGSSEYQPRAIKLSLVDQYVRVFWPFFVCFVWLSLNGSALRGTAAFFFFSPLLPNPKKSSGVAFPDSNVNNKKSEEREKKG